MIRASTFQAETPERVSLGRGILRRIMPESGNQAMGAASRNAAT